MQKHVENACGIAQVENPGIALNQAQFSTTPLLVPMPPRVAQVVQNLLSRRWLKPGIHLIWFAAQYTGVL